MSRKPQNLTVWRGINMALHDILEEVPESFIMGEDISAWGTGGGIYGTTRKLGPAFGAERVRETPISEEVLLASAVGAAMRGTRPILEIMYSDFSFLGFDAIINQGAKARYMFGGQFDVPMVIRSNGGSGIGKAAQHSQSLETLFAHIPGLEVVLPSTANDAYGLLRYAIETPNPTIFLEHKAMYYDKGLISFEKIPFGQANVAREGNDVTIVATQQLFTRSLEAAEQLAEQGIDCEVIDPRTLYPFDWETVMASVRKTRHLVVAYEAVQDFGWGAEVVSKVAEEAWNDLDAAPVRIGGKRVPIPYSEPLETASVPQVDDVIAAVKTAVGK